MKWGIYNWKLVQNAKFCKIIRQESIFEWISKIYFTSKFPSLQKPFQTRNYGSMYFKEQQNYGLLNFEDDSIVRDSNLGRMHPVRAGPRGRLFLWPLNLTACSSAAVTPTKTHSSSLERSKPNNNIFSAQEIGSI